MKELKSLLPFIKKYIFSILLGFIFIFIQNFGMVKIPGTIKSILDEIVGKNRKSIIINDIIKVLVITIFVAISLFLMRKIIIGVSRKIEYDIRKKLFAKLLSLDYYFFLKNRSGDLSSRITNDLNDVRVLLGPGMMYIPNSLSRLSFFIPVLVGLSGFLMAITGLMMIGLIILILFLMPKIRPYFAKIQKRTGSINNRVWQILTGISTIKQNTMETRETERFLALGNLYFKDQMSLVMLRGFFRPLFIFIFSLIELVVLLIGGRMVINGEMTIGELLQFNIMVSALIFPVLSFGWVMSMIQQGISAMVRINYILDKQQPENKHKISLNEKEVLSFDITNLNFKYPGDEKETLKNISFKVKAGQTIGITGLVGSGKTTLIDILTGILSPEKNMVFINGIDITKINIESLYNRISVVSQEPFLFSRSISDNISLSIKKDISKVKKSAKLAAFHDEIQDFKYDYDQIIGERGISLSGGQKQRTAIARALNNPANVLFLDDPLSSVDSKTEEIILNNLKELSLKKNLFKTIFIVSHRISTLKNADNILVLRNGSIIEHGKHNYLINKKGLYCQLSEMQKMEEF